MEFKEFKEAMQHHVASMLQDQTTLFVANVNVDVLWGTYLDSFPVGMNPIFRERREHDCSCCRHFVRQFGNVVAIENGQAISIWDFETGDEKYQPVLEAMSEYLASSSVRDVFVTGERAFGTDKNFEELKDGHVRIWEHFYTYLPERFISTSGETVAAIMAKYRDVRSVFKRSLDEIKLDAIETVLDLIAQKSLYKGDEWRGALEMFRDLHLGYWLTPENERGLFCWTKSVKIGGAIGKIKNHSIGVLLTDISNGVDLNEAVRKYEAIVAPQNYKRPKAIFTKKMVAQAQKTIEEMGLTESLGRRHATIDDINVNNIIFGNKDAVTRMSGGVFDELLHDATPTNYGFDRVEEITIEHFVEHVLPRATDVSAFIENKLAPNFVSLIAPTDQNSTSLFKWNNGFSWAYAGNIADSSMKERVKAAGGNVEGILRFSIQWNDGERNRNDFDAHCIEPNANHIYFQSAGVQHRSTGMLDVDIINPKTNVAAVENIVWTSLAKMNEGEYSFYVHNYHHKGGRTGFSAEIEFDGQIYSFEYGKELRENENVWVAKVLLKDGKFEIIESLPSSTSSRDIWGIQTGEFHPVSVAMFSPNYWDGQTGVGHRHYFFILADCINQDQPNGFFNEFLREEFMPHKRVFEALGAKMRVEQSNEQLSGVGFSSTKRNSLVVKLEGHTSRAVRVVF